MFLPLMYFSGENVLAFFWNTLLRSMEKVRLSFLMKLRANFCYVNFIISHL